MSETSINPELALPWQKLAAALADLLGAEASAATPRPGLDDRALTRPLPR